MLHENTGFFRQLLPRSVLPRFPKGSINDKPSQSLGFKPSGPHIVALIFDKFDFCWPAILKISFDQDLGIKMIRDNLVVIAVDMENRDLCGSQRLEPFGGVVFVKRCFQFILCHADADLRR